MTDTNQYSTGPERDPIEAAFDGQIDGFLTVGFDTVMQIVRGTLAIPETRRKRLKRVPVKEFQFSDVVSGAFYRMGRVAIGAFDGEGRELTIRTLELSVPDDRGHYEEAWRLDVFQPRVPNLVDSIYSLDRYINEQDALANEPNNQDYTDFISDLFKIRDAFGFGAHRFTTEY